jgi:hypothetical protein
MLRRFEDADLEPCVELNYFASASAAERYSRGTI